VTITLHKLQLQGRWNTRQKRSLHRENHFSSEDSLLGIQPQLAAGNPTPLDAVALADLVEHLLRPLPSEQRRILELRLQGYSLFEIANESACSEWSVRHLLSQVKERLEELISDERNAS
jgi:DNA-directed RNA polymerase specialized sigma24 family protein